MMRFMKNSAHFDRLCDEDSEGARVPAGPTATRGGGTGRGRLV